MENNQSIEILPKKYGIELKCSARGEWYIGSISIHTDSKEDLKEAL